MARLRYYLQSVASGYVSMGANILCTLVSVPLALSYLSEQEFGLWALATQIGFYIALVDFGMAGAMSRILIDYKDKGHGIEFSSVVRTGITVHIIQGLLVICFGAVGAFVLGPLLNVPPDLRQEFSRLILGQSVVLAIGFALKIFGTLLVANHRSDIGNYAQVVGSAANLVFLWICFEQGIGVYSVIWAQAGSVLLATSVLVVACFTLKLWSSTLGGAYFDRGKFRELFDYGKDVFLFSVGSQLINGSHLIIVTRVLGLEAAAVWSVCTRAFVLAIQLVWRAMEFSGPALSEMLVRKEEARLSTRFRHLTVFTTSLAAAVGLIFASCNQSFVRLWTGPQFNWPILNDLLLTCWLILIIVQRCYISLLGVMKKLQIAKYVYFAEGFSLLLIGFAVTRPLGFAGLIVTSAACTAAFSCLYGLQTTARQFHLRVGELVGAWLLPALRVLAVGAPFAILVCVVTASLDLWSSLLLRASLVSSISGVLLWRWGLPQELKDEFIDRSPQLLRRALGLSTKSSESSRGQA